MPKKSVVKPGATKAGKSTSSKAPAKKVASKPSSGAAAPAAAADPAPKAPELIGVEIKIKQLDRVLQDENGTIKETGRWPLVIDPTGRAGTFLRYQYANYLQALNPADMQPEALRKALIGAIRYGKPLAIDMIESDMYENIRTQMDEIEKGLLDCLVSKDILKDEKYLSVVKESDGEEYHQFMFADENLHQFMFVLLTQIAAPKEELLHKFYTVTILEN